MACPSIGSRQRKRCAAKALRAACRLGRFVNLMAGRAPTGGVCVRVSVTVCVPSGRTVDRRTVPPRPQPGSRPPTHHLMPLATKRAVACVHSQNREWPFAGVSHLPHVCGVCTDVASRVRILTDACRVGARPFSRDFRYVLAFSGVGTRQRKAPLRGGKGALRAQFHNFC